MNDAVFIAGDWGSTNLRLYLCRFAHGESVEALACLSGPGVMGLNSDFEAILFDLIGDWLELYGPVPVILSGAVGSNIGWHEVTYLDCPASPDQISNSTTKFTVRGLDIWILSGLKTRTELGAPDMMRGEELQLLGWMLETEEHSEQIVVLPGTHNKWALVAQGQVQTFVTAFTGELYALLEKHSILITQPLGDNFSADYFLQGVALSRTLQAGQLLNALFTVRSRQIEGMLNAEHGASYLSGLLVGSDIVGSLGLLKNGTDSVGKITLIGDSILTQAYQMALESMNIEARICDSDQIAICGYQAIYKTLFNACDME
ncbi:2-dehydro-3-deoxygalactonokinase [SAR92 clade bacterium H921]|nr:2-dehydro-3-deoxygalactonokinase [SAR92 clade bacterium H921]